MSFRRLVATPLLAACSISVGFLAGCKQTVPIQQKRSYSETLNKFYEGRPLCLWQDTVKFPVENATPQQVEDLGLDALEEAGLVAQKHGGKRGAQKLRTYELTDAGRAALNPDVFNPGAGNFCYGRRTVSSIDKARENSRSTALVDYHYGLPSPSAWAAQPAVENAFPDVAIELAGQHAAEATLLHTTDGWEVSGTPATIFPVAKHKHGAILAQAKNLIHHLKKTG